MKLKGSKASDKSMYPGGVGLCKDRSHTFTDQKTMSIISWRSCCV